MMKVVKIFKDKGLRGAIDTVNLHFQSDIKYNRWFKKNRITIKELEEQKKKSFIYNPKISLIVPAFHTQSSMMLELIESVLRQSYSNWELCISIGCPKDEHLIELLTQKIYDDRIKYIVSKKDLRISENTNRALTLATGDYIGFLDHDDIIEPDALYEIVNVLQKKADVVYTDEDKVNSNLTRYSSPYFKPDFSIDLLRCQNYITHLFIVKYELLQQVGFLSPELDGAQDYDLILRCIEQAESIIHIPKILYHWRKVKGSTAEKPESKMYCYEAGKKALENHLKRNQIEAEVHLAKLLGRYHVFYGLKEKPLLSIVIVNATDESKNKIENAITKLGGYSNVEFVYENDKNISVAYNNGAERAMGQYILFVAGTVYPIGSYSVYEMISLCMQENVGLVAPKIMYRNNRIKHAGMILGYRNRVGYAFRGCDKNATTYMNRAEQNGNYSAVSSDVIMMSKELYRNVGGYKESEDWNLSQVLFCTQVLKKKYRIVYNAFSEWCDDSYKSDGISSVLSNDEWNDIAKMDPFYNKNLSLVKKLFELD